MVPRQQPASEPLARMASQARHSSIEATPVRRRRRCLLAALVLFALLNLTFALLALLFCALALAALAAFAALAALAWRGRGDDRGWGGRRTKTDTQRATQERGGQRQTEREQHKREGDRGKHTQSNTTLSDSRQFGGGHLSWCRHEICRARGLGSAEAVCSLAPRIYRFCVCERRNERRAGARLRGARLSLSLSLSPAYSTQLITTKRGTLAPLASPFPLPASGAWGDRKRAPESAGSQRRCAPTGICSRWGIRLLRHGPGMRGACWPARLSLTLPPASLSPPPRRRSAGIAAANRGAGAAEWPAVVRPSAGTAVSSASAGSARACTAARIFPLVLQQPPPPICKNVWFDREPVFSRSRARPRPAGQCSGAVCPYDSPESAPGGAVSTGRACQRDPRVGVLAPRVDPRAPAWRFAGITRASHRPVCADSRNSWQRRSPVSLGCPSRGSPSPLRPGCMR